MKQLNIFVVVVVFSIYIMLVIMAMSFCQVWYMTVLLGCVFACVFLAFIKHCGNRYYRLVKKLHSHNHLSKKCIINISIHEYEKKFTILHIISKVLSTFSDLKMG
ncbi:hypothetical protein EGW08_021594 [Elysia chlorotica]|uniref:Uncharacterized protein n=1 Tax=Elysia chlorotica TaxID=188477 RepID=A0A3S0Z4Q3_ELYCH|nr:hypothetical protein EGW08_021594 [Elysia chlorotica]